MPGLNFRTRHYFYDAVPVLASLLLAMLYFLSVVPDTRPHWRRYLIAAVVMLVLDRLGVTVYRRLKILAPMSEYLRRRRAGDTFTQAELEHYYRALAAHVPVSQAIKTLHWAVASLAISALCYFWIQPTWTAFLGVLFSSIIAATISIAFSYFLLKMQIRPLIEEIAASLEKLPDVSRVRLSFTIKIGASIVAMAVVAFTSFGVMFYSRMNTELDRFALRSGANAARRLAGEILQSRPSQWGDLLRQSANPYWMAALVDAKGRVLSAQPDSTASLSAFPAAIAKRMGTIAGQRGSETSSGGLLIIPAGAGRFLAVTANTHDLDSVVKSLGLVGFLFLLATVAVFSGYTIWLSRDTAYTLRQTAAFNRRLAGGDLSRTPAIWSDDELGAMADDLRTTFRSLRRMTGEVSEASATVDAEVNRTVSVTRDLHEQVAAQAHSADRTTLSVKSMEEGMQSVSVAMGQVAGATQEVSSTILQMQASVEEIARNSEVLMRSVEKTASSSNQISASASEIESATDRLHQSGQEAVSFLTELDASLEETRDNARTLAEAATRMTRDAEAGYGSVSAVIEEILRTNDATRESRSALTELMASIEQIGRIVDIIQDVTEQTNLLSLNASIIAAGAGEYGKSFAVVATQIRELSSRTAGNAKEIRTLIQTLTRSGSDMEASMDRTFTVVTNSADLSRTAGEALKTILESASTQEQMNRRIAEAADEVAHGGEAASNAMHQMFEMIEGIARASRDQAASTRYLNEEAERVRDVALQLKGATEEQARGTALINDAMGHILEDSRRTTQSIQAQASESSAIFDAMRQVAGSASAIEDAFGKLSQVAELLRRSAEVLRAEIRNFKTVA